MDEIYHIKGLDVLRYLRTNGVSVDDTLCAGVPDEVAKKNKKSKSHCVLDILLDDKKGVLSSHFPDYYNRFPEATQPIHVSQLQEAFQKFIQQILFGKKDHTTSLTPPLAEPTPDVLGEKIGILIHELRAQWMVWSIQKGYLDMILGVEKLLPLLQKKYQNPMLVSDANLIETTIQDVIPDEYINFLYDITMTLYHIYTVKISTIQNDLDVWKLNTSLLSDIHSIAKTLIYDMAWSVFDMPHGRPHTISDLCTDIIEGINTMHLIVQENSPENPEKKENPEEET